MIGYSPTVSRSLLNAAIFWFSSQQFPDDDQLLCRFGNHVLACTNYMLPMPHIDTSGGFSLFLATALAMVWNSMGVTTDCPSLQQWFRQNSSMVFAGRNLCESVTRCTLDTNSSLTNLVRAAMCTPTESFIPVRPWLDHLEASTKFIMEHGMELRVMWVDGLQQLVVLPFKIQEGKYCILRLQQCFLPVVLRSTDGGKFQVICEVLEAPSLCENLGQRSLFRRLNDLPSRIVYERWRDIPVSYRRSFYIV